MAAHITRTRLQKFGKISIVKVDAPAFAGLFLGTKQPKIEVYGWQPLKSLRSSVFEGFELRMAALPDPLGGRRFLPGPDHSQFILLAALGGDAILNRRQSLNGEQRSSYRATRLIIQLAPRLREFFRRDFQKEQDLYLSRAEGGGTVLPPDLGLTRSGRGKPWGPAEVIRQGRTEAEALGRDSEARTSAAFIRLGLLKAAKLNPVDVKTLTAREALAIVRLGMFDLGPCDSTSQADVELVTERLLGAIENHLDDSADQFKRWFGKEVDNIVHQIAKKRRPGAPLAREQVRQALLEIVFASFRHVGDCVDLQTQDFARALPRRRALTPLERARFDALYRKQAWLGGLPLVLLHVRFDFLDEFLRELHADPTNPEHPGVLLRLLSYYGAMTARRREADRGHKRRGKHRNRHGRRGVTEPLNEGSAMVTEPVEDEFHQIAALLREQYNVECRCRGQAVWDAGLITGTAKGKKIVLCNKCRICGYERILSVSPKEIRVAGDRLRNE